MTEEQLEKILNQPKPWYEIAKGYISTIVMVIGFTIMIVGPFTRQAEEQHSLRKDLNAVTYVVWSLHPEADDFISNPYKTRNDAYYIPKNYNKPWEDFNCIVQITPNPKCY